MLVKIAYHAENRGAQVIRIGQWEPTTQTCSVCGGRGGRKPLHVRTWQCPNCLSVLNRDYNAAVNILVAAGQAETLNDCGGDVRRSLASADPDEAVTHRTDPAPRRTAAQGSPPLVGRMSSWQSTRLVGGRYPDRHRGWARGADAPHDDGLACRRGTTAAGSGRMPCVGRTPTRPGPRGPRAPTAITPLRPHDPARGSREPHQPSWRNR